MKKHPKRNKKYPKFAISIFALLFTAIFFNHVEAVETIHIEAEYSTQMVSPMQVESDSLASNGQYIYAPNGTGTFYTSPTSSMATYDVEISEAGDYVFWGRVIALYSNDDSFFVQINDGKDNLWDVQADQDWHWDKVKDRTTGEVKVHLEAGMHTIKIKHREDGTKIDKFILTNDLDFIPVDPKPEINEQYIWFESENADNIVAPMQAESDPSASGNQLLYAPSGTGTFYTSPTSSMASYTININEAGSYVLWGRTIATYSNDDSFFVQFDLGKDNLWDVPASSSWQWNKVKDRYSGEVKINLNAGGHTIHIKHREDGTKIDRLLLTNDLDYIPTGEGQVCGNGVLESPEACDDGNLVSEDGCSSQCVVESCGDGIVQIGLGEVCEVVSVISCASSSGYVGTQDCLSSCTYGSCTQIEFCGDGIVQAIEECDDGGDADGDGCSSTCLVEEEKDNEFLDPDGMARVDLLEDQLDNLTVISSHPRIILNQEKLPGLKAKIGQSSWDAVLSEADNGNLVSSALAFLMLEDLDPFKAVSYAEQVYDIISTTTYANWCATGLYDHNSRIDIALASLAFDWAYNGLTSVQRDEIITKLSTAADLTSKKLEIDVGTVPTKGPTACYKHATQGETFHREEWAFYAYGAWPEIALSGHDPFAEEVYKARWRYDWYWGDAARMESYVNDGTPFEGYYFGNDGISWFTALESATGINLVDGNDFDYNSEAAYHLLYRFDIPKSLETMHKGVAYNTSINSFLKSDGSTWKLREHIARTFLPTADQDPHLQWIVNNKLNKYSSWLMTNNYFNSIGDLYNVSKLIFYDEDAPALDPTLATYSDLPFDRHFDGGNEVYMRTGWDDQATIVGFRSKPAFTMNSHSDYDVNTFVAYRDGPLLVDSGVYDAYQQQKNYFQYQKNTIAHNNILIINPNDPDGPKKLANAVDPGGTDNRATKSFGSPGVSTNKIFIQKDPTANWADVTKYESHPDYAYTVGDAEEAYGDRLSKYDRNLAFLRKDNNEGFLIVFDRVSATDSSYKKKWLLHTVGEPSVSGNIIDTEVTNHIETHDGDYMVAENYEQTSKVHAKFLLPESHTVRRVSGEILHTQGTVSISTGSDVVTGVGTSFTNEMVGHYFHVNKDQTSKVPNGVDGYYDWFKIESVQSPTQLTLEKDYTHVSAISEAYTINQGYQFWVDGTNPRNVFVTGATKARSTNTATGKAWQHMGQGRIELMPPDGNKTDYFLVAMYLSDIDSSMPINTKKIESASGTPMVGVHMDDKVVLFGKTGGVVSDTTFSISHDGEVDFLLTDLNPGQIYTVTKGGEIVANTPASAQGTIYFNDTPGAGGTVYGVK